MRGARGRERGPGGRTGGPLLVTGGRRRPPGERGDQGWWDQETASTLGKRRRRWGTIMVHSSHGPSHGSPRRVAPDHMLLAGSTATLAPGATARLHSLPASAWWPGAMLLPGWCGNPPQYSGGSSWLEGVGASLEPAAAPRTRLSTEIGHDTNLSLLRTPFFEFNRI